MKFIDFTKLEGLPEGTDVDILDSEEVQDFIKGQFDQSFDKRFEVEASGLKTTNSELKGEKQKIQEILDRFKDVDLEEYAQLKTFRENNGDAGKQLAAIQAEKEILRAERDGIEDSFKNKMQLLQNERDQSDMQLAVERLNNQVQSGIRAHNTNFPAVATKPGMERWIMEEASKVWIRDDQGKYVPMKGDRVLTGPEGNVMSYSEWVNSLRTQGEFQAMFNEPVGGGARGGVNGGGRQPFNPKDMAGTPEQRRQALRNRFPELD